MTGAACMAQPVW